MKVWAVYAYGDGLLGVFRSEKSAEEYRSEIGFDYGVDGQRSNGSYFVEDIVIEEAELSD